MFNVGDFVKLKTPFNVSFSGNYQILGLSETPDTYKVDIWNDGVGSDFFIDFLESV